MGLHQANLLVLIQDTEGVTFSFKDDTDGLGTKIKGQNYFSCKNRNEDVILELNEVM